MANKSKKTSGSKTSQPVAAIAAAAAADAKTLDYELTGVRLQVSKFREHMDDNGLGDLNFSSLVSGTGLIAPFVTGVQAAIKAENELAVAHAKSLGQKNSKGALGDTAKNLKQFDEAVEGISKNIGSALLPAINNMVTGLQPMLTSIGEFVANNPSLVEGLAAAAVAFVVVTAAAMGAATVFGVLASPLGIAAAVVAVVAGLIVANWDRIKSALEWSPVETLVSGWASVTEFFSGLWASIGAAVDKGWAEFKALFNWSPKAVLAGLWGDLSGFLIGILKRIPAAAVQVKETLKEFFRWTPTMLLINNWATVTGFFSETWQQIKTQALGLFDELKTRFSWNPMVLITDIWDSLGAYFTGLWESLKGMASAFMDTFKSVFDWSPVEMVSAYWDALIAWFVGWGEQLEVVLAPIREAISGIGGLMEKAGSSVRGFFGSQGSDAEGGAQVPGFFRKDADQASSGLALSSSLPQSSSSLLQQLAVNNRAQLEGGLTLRFENAPAGLRAEQAKTNQPGLSVASTIGYRSLSLGGSYA
ncbi:MAG: phage tail tape measure protein [Candidatus Pseudomonas colombiensis]|nr:MAG: phage tail tape measure protein [Pseudomonas sp.]